MSEPWKKRRCLVVEWTSLPEPLKSRLAERDRFGNDVLLPMHSEFKPCELTEQAVREYHADQIARTDRHATFRGGFEEFVEQYGLQFEMWLISQGIDLSDVDEVLLNVCW